MSETTNRCYYYDEQRNRCNCYVDENLNEPLEENVNLRVQLANAMVTVRRVDERCAKLRELVRDFDKCLTEAVRLAYIQGHATIYDGTLLDSLHPRMRELGIEVTDA